MVLWSFRISLLLGFETGTRDLGGNTQLVPFLEDNPSACVGPASPTPELLGGGGEGTAPSLLACSHNGH